MRENTTVNIPFRLRDASSAFAQDANLANYDIVIYKAGVVFAAVPAIVALGSKGRHFLQFNGPLEDQYQIFVDHNTAGFATSVESAWCFFDKYLSSDLYTLIQASSPTATATAVWAALTAASNVAGSFGVFLKRILQLCEPDVVIDKNLGTMTLKDKTTGAVLVVYQMTGSIDSNITTADAT